MRVFVTGGTGAIGSHAVPALVAAGHQVTALARTPAKAAVLEAQGATPITVSLFDRAGLTDAFAGHDAVANLATALPSTRDFVRAKAWADNHRVREEGSTNVVEAALAAGVGRVLQESVAMLYEDRGAEWIDEDVPTVDFPIARSGYAAEANAARFTAAGGVGVVLRLGWFYGPGAAHSDQFIALARRHLPPQTGPSDTYVSSIHLADGGEAVVAALGVPAGIYNVVDDEPVTRREYAETLAAAVGKRPWLRLPGRLALLLGDRTRSLTTSFRVSNARFKAAAGWSPRYPSVRQGWPAAVAAAASDP